MMKSFSLQIDVSKRALKTELEEIENKSLNTINDVLRENFQNQITILEDRINSTNEEVDIQSENINELKVYFFEFTAFYQSSNLISYLYFYRLIFRQYHQTQTWRQ